MIHALSFTLYLGAFLLWIRFLLKGSPGEGPRHARWVAGAAVLVHAAALVEFRLRHGELPLAGPGAALSSLAFVGGLAVVATAPLRTVSRVAIGLLPVVALFLGAAILIGIEPSPRALDFQGAGFVLHVTFAFLGYQGLALACAAGVLYLIQHHEIKTKRLGRFFHFIPPLATLDVLGRVGLGVGFAALTLSLALGWAWTAQNRGGFALSDPKVMWGILSWTVFVGIAAVRRLGGRSEYRGAVAAAVGFGLVVATYLVLRLTVAAEGFFL